MTQIDWTRATKYLLMQDMLKGLSFGSKSAVLWMGITVFLPFSLALTASVAFMAKFEVFGGFDARWALGA